MGRTVTISQVCLLKREAKKKGGWGRRSLLEGPLHAAGEVGGGSMEQNCAREREGGRGQEGDNILPSSQKVLRSSLKPGLRNRAAMWSGGDVRS